MGWLKNMILGKPKVMPTSINESNFQAEVFKSEQPVVLDVWGPSCAPCKRLEPVIVDLATRYAGQVKFGELNAAANPKLMRRLRVSGTPTIIYFRNGSELERTVGFRSSLYLSQTIDEVLLGQPAEG